ncbi:hypothetical protein [Aliarcobacter thereius]|uniref:Uncharacterized protein n=1 Tax=Aliarcobacter thereius LMG 24486 TaxID=1032240 RepID=A0A1C7WQ16_9BACT|nr:hypothetical protein [Aliarcobacter thereius]OCL95729.1 hypothetical protein AA347_01209 [Aliarcobacter thereius LMG 24486]QBF16289.1 putative membrane protein [Aliarcobacter thereius LMG 24486]TLS92088.1 hypothetical protein FE244_06695 [Aliarcobacter thereius]
MKIDFLRILAFINITLIFILAIYLEGLKNTLFGLLIIGTVVVFLIWKKEDYRVKKFINNFF